ncbi:MAG: hypothetical protein GY842_19350 [bacterium]|nr:hypothetical protein [bacterium]
MRYRTRQVLIRAVIAVLAVSLVVGITWIVWYDRSRGAVSSNPAEDIPARELGLATRIIEADMRMVEGTIEPDGILGMILARFHRRAGRYPANLGELHEAPSDLPPSRWDGPYVGTSGLLNDPWGRRYEYQCPGEHNQERYDLWSVGPDGTSGTADDIGNW